MLTGFNTDFKYNGVVYHVQTEDNGRKNPTIVTLLYRGGAILASRKTSYADIIKFERLEKVVRELMEQQHKQVIKDLMAGKLGNTGGVKVEAAPGPEAEAVEAEIVEDASGPVSLEKKGEKSVKSVNMDEFILDYLASEEGE